MGFAPLRVFGRILFVNNGKGIKLFSISFNFFEYSSLLLNILFINSVDGCIEFMSFSKGEKIFSF